MSGRRLRSAASSPPEPAPGPASSPACPTSSAFSALRAGTRRTRSLVIEFDVDDQSPEDLAAGLERLRDVAGVRDVISFQGIGKKGRWIQSVRIMADPARREPIVAAVFEETTTLGLRIRQEERAVLPRRAVIVEDGGREVRVKIAERAEPAYRQGGGRRCGGQGERRRRSCGAAPFGGGEGASL